MLPWRKHFIFSRTLCATYTDCGLDDIASHEVGMRTKRWWRRYSKHCLDSSEGGYFYLLLQLSCGPDVSFSLLVLFPLSSPFRVLSVVSVWIDLCGRMKVSLLALAAGVGECSARNVLRGKFVWRVKNRKNTDVSDQRHILPTKHLPQYRQSHSHPPASASRQHRRIAQQALRQLGQRQSRTQPMLPEPAAPW